MSIGTWNWQGEPSTQRTHSGWDLICVRFLGVSLRLTKRRGGHNWLGWAGRQWASTYRRSWIAPFCWQMDIQSCTTSLSSTHEWTGSFVSDKPSFLRAIRLIFTGGEVTYILGIFNQLVQSTVLHIELKSIVILFRCILFPRSKDTRLFIKLSHVLVMTVLFYDYHRPGKWLICTNSYRGGFLRL